MATFVYAKWVRAALAKEDDHVATSSIIENGDEQRRVAEPIPRVDVRAPIEKYAENLERSLLGCEMERREPIAVCVIRVITGIQPCEHFIDAILEGRVVKRDPTELVDRVLRPRQRFKATTGYGPASSKRWSFAVSSGTLSTSFCPPYSRRKPARPSPAGSANSGISGEP